MFAHDDAFLKERSDAMNIFCSFVMLGFILLPASAMSETYKCRSPDGKISYAGQLSLTPGVKCEQMFVKKQAVVVQEAQAATAPESGETAETGPQIPPPTEGATAAPASDAKRPDTKNKTPEADATRKKPEKAAPEKSASDKQAEQKLKEENCQSAKANLRTYQVGGRISKVSESGEKIYLDDAEIKQKSQEAQKEVDKWCGS